MAMCAQEPNVLNFESHLIFLIQGLGHHRLARAAREPGSSTTRGLGVLA
jgi:hypothetical protein